MADETLQQGAWGVPVEVTIKDETGAILPIDTSTSRKFIFKKPDGDRVVRDAVFVTDGTDGLLQYTSTDQEQLYDQIGPYRIQAIVTLPTMESPTGTAVIEVLPNL